MQIYYNEIYYKGNKRILKDCWPHEDQLTVNKSSSMIVVTMDFKIMGQLHLI